LVFEESVHDVSVSEGVCGEPEGLEVGVFILTIEHAVVQALLFKSDSPQSIPVEPVVDLYVKEDIEN